ncbi:MAG: FAD-binding protein [Deltaproteobacteria bacterium]|nr:FAD-binding protein [Deltaproteobacteria bacterium]
MEIVRLSADVLIVGGGLAGTNAAMGAAEKGATVIVADKGKIERSGDAGGGIDHFMAFLNQNQEWDTQDAFLGYVERIGRGTGHLSIIESVYCAELPAAIERMERIGNPLTQADGTYYRTKSMGQPGPYWINFNGKKLKPRLGAAVRRLGCTVLDKVMMVDLLTQDGAVVGAIGFHIRSGTFYVIHAKATVIATGNTNRLYENPRLNPFNTWLCPFDTGDGQVMAFRAGVTLSNMEYMRMTLLPKGFAAPGFNALVGMGGRFLNSLGEYYMEKRHPMGNRATRYDVVFHTLQEIREGHGPIYIDCRRLEEKDLAHLMRTLGYDKDTLPDYFAQRGEDLREKPVEITVSEGMQAGPTEVTGSGIKIDRECASTVAGLFACGDAADHNRCVHGAVAGGYKAGKSAARHASRSSVPEPPRETAIKQSIEWFLAPLNRRSGYPYRQVENAVRKIMSEHAGAMRTEIGLQVGIEKLKRLEKYLDEMKAADIHDLMRTHETRSLLEVGKIMATAALFRTESRNKPYHHRLDYPDTDDKWCGLVAVKKEGDRISCSFEPVVYKMGAGIL